MGYCIAALIVVILVTAWLVVRNRPKKKAVKLNLRGRIVPKPKE